MPYRDSMATEFEQNVGTFEWAMLNLIEATVKRHGFEEGSRVVRTGLARILAAGAMGSASRLDVFVAQVQNAISTLLGRSLL